MGVRGLSSYVQERKDEFLANCKLHDEVLAIDGDNLMYHLTNSCKKLNHAFGGDYEKFATRVHDFFNTLNTCAITPIVLLDGGSHPSKIKLKTSFKRLGEKQRRARSLNASNQTRVPLLPLLAKATFIEVLRRLGVSHAVCAFEADASVAALARRLRCAVLSDDTDFFAYGVRCVLLSSLNEEVEPTAAGGRCLDAVEFLHTRFMERCGLCAELLPVLGCLAGNDHIAPSALQQFLLHLPRPYNQRKGSDTRRRIKGLLLWLRRHTSPEGALQEVLSQVRKEDRPRVRALLERSVADYRQPAPTSGLCLPPQGTPSEAQAEDGTTESEEIVTPELSDEVTIDGKPLPDWLQCHLRRGHVTGDVTNLITDHPLLMEPQVEDLRFPAAGGCALPLLQWLLRLLRGAEATATVYQRPAGGGRSVQRCLLRAALATAPPAPQLTDVPALSEQQRRPVLLDVLETREADVAQLPAELQLPAAAASFWRRHSSHPVTACHLGALLASHLRHQVSLASLSRPDPALLSGEKQQDRRLSHQWAELQAVLAAAGNVNAVLDTPLPAVSPAQLLCGPLLYNSCRQLQQLGSNAAEEWFPAETLLEWRRLLLITCRVVGVPVEMQPGRRTKVASGVTSAPRLDHGVNSLTVEDSLRLDMDQLTIAGDDEHLVTKTFQPPPQLRNNPFSALMVSCGESSDESC